MIRSPSEEEIFRFVAGTHECDRINIPYSHITGTWHQKQAPDPYAQGHFRAFMYARDVVIPSTDFPAKAPELLTTLSDTESALFWLREIHRKMAEPLTRHVLLEEDPNAPTLFSLGKYRFVPATAVTKPAPPPELIPKLMHNWIRDYATFHHKIKEKVKNPYGVDKDTAIEINRRVYDVNLFFAVVQPMACLNQRMGRFLENVFRIAWCLPMKFYSPGWGDEYRKLLPDLEIYQNEQLPKLLEKIGAVRG